VDVVLTDLIRRYRVRHDVEAYTRTPPTAEEAAIGQAHPDWSDLADDTDWDAQWPDDHGPLLRSDVGRSGSPSWTSVVRWWSSRGIPSAGCCSR